MTWLYALFRMTSLSPLRSLGYPASFQSEGSVNKSGLQLDKNGSCCQHRLNRWHDFSHRRAAAEDGLYLSDHLASVGRGSNHDAHDADISLASRKVSYLLEDASLGVSPVLSTRNVGVMIASVATLCLLFRRKTE